MDSICFYVQDQLGIDDLSYEDQEGMVSGEDVIRDIVEKGSFLAKERQKNKMNSEKNIHIEELPDEQILTKDYFW